MKTIGYVGGVLFVVFGALFIIAGTNPETVNPFLIIAIGVVLVLIGFVLFWFASRKPKTQPDANVTYKVDLSGDVNLESMKCKNCGGTLSSENVKMVAGAPVVTCPYCGSIYQLSEEPKW